MEAEFNELDARDGWAALYQVIRNESGQFDYTIKEAKKVENKYLNRYRDVSPYDHSRVILQRGDCNYINASHLEVPDAQRAYILTQGPLPSTTSHFWQMVWEQNSKAVLMLNKVIEKHAVKCHQYWPLGVENNGLGVMDLEDVGLCVKYISEEEASYYTVRHLQLTDLQTGESRIVLHFHYTTWPDFSVPQSPSAFLNFLFAVRNSEALSKNVGPPVVHCSAGIGRSGTFCLVDSCLILIEKYRDLNAVDIKKVLLDMRKYRMGLIQTPDQLRFSYLAILEGSHRVLNNIIVNEELRNTEEENGIENVECPKDKTTKRELEKDNGDDIDPSGGSDSYDEDKESSPISENTSVSSASTDSLPSLPPKRIRRNCSDSDGSEVNHKNEVINERINIHNSANDSIQNNNAAIEGCENNVKSINDRRGSQETSTCTMTMKDGAVVTNFGDKLKEAELRKRQRKERNEKLSQKVREIQVKQQENEKWRHRRSFLKPISFSLLFLLGGGYLVYRWLIKD